MANNEGLYFEHVKTWKREVIDYEIMQIVSFIGQVEK